MKQSLVLLCLIPLAACSSSKGPDKKPELTPDMIDRYYERVLTRMDANADNRITCTDILYLREEQFRLLDENKNGTLSEFEYRGAQFEDKAFMFHSLRDLDKNENGNLDRREFETVADNTFLSMDSDGDCTVSPLEAATSEQKRRFQDARGERPDDKRPRRAPDDGGVDPF